MNTKNEYGYFIMLPDKNGSMDKWLPKLETDELFSESFGWYASCLPKFVEGNVYHRLILAGEGYRILGVDELCKNEHSNICEWTKDGINWCLLLAPDIYVKEIIASRSEILAIRVPVQPKTEKILCKNCGKEIELIKFNRGGELWVHKENEFAPCDLVATPSTTQ